MTVQLITNQYRSSLLEFGSQRKTKRLPIWRHLGSIWFNAFEYKLHKCMLFTQTAKSVNDGYNIRLWNWTQTVLEEGKKYCCHYETILKVNTKEPSTSACVLLWPSFKLSNSDYKINSICVYFKFKCISNQSVHDTTSVLSQRKNIDFMHRWFLKGCNCMITLATKMHLGENLKKKRFSLSCPFVFLVLLNLGGFCLSCDLMDECRWSPMFYFYPLQPCQRCKNTTNDPNNSSNQLACHNNDSLSTQKLSA